MPLSPSWVDSGTKTRAAPLSKYFANRRVKLQIRPTSYPCVSHWTYNNLGNSGTGANLKVGWGTCAAQTARNFPVVSLALYGSESTISRIGERFCDGQYSLVSFLFAVLLLTVHPTPPCPAICKSGGTCLPCPMESAPLLRSNV